MKDHTGMTNLAVDASGTSTGQGPVPVSGTPAGNVIRAIQSRLPWLLESKAAVQRTARRLLRRPFEPEFAILASLDLGSGVILDIGANRGQSIDAVRLYKPAAPVIAFEPNGFLAQRLHARFAADRQLSVNVFGLGAEPMRAPLFVPYYCGFMYDGLASFDRAEAAGWLGPHTMAWFDPRHLEIRETVCEVRVLDTLGLAPAFIKIDVQGFEQHVLQGGADTIATHRPVILMENNPEAEAWLADRGWVRCAWIDGRLVAGTRGAMNNLFFHPEARARVAHLLD